MVVIELLDIPQRGVEDELNDAALFVREQRGKRVVHVAVVGIEQADDLGEVGAQDLVRGLRDELVEGFRLRDLICLLRPR